MAKFGSGPEPLEGFYVGIVFKGEMVLLVGDLRKEALKKTGAVPSLFNSIFVSKKEHLVGKNVYGSKTRFTENGLMHSIVIECDANGNDDLCLIVRVDSKPVMKVKHLRWKFRGNYTILVDGLPVEIFWDVHNWLFGTTLGNAIFMFQTCLSAEKLWTGETVLDDSEQQWPCLPSFKESKVSSLDGDFGGSEGVSCNEVRVKPDDNGRKFQAEYHLMQVSKVKELGAKKAWYQVKAVQEESKVFHADELLTHNENLSLINRHEMVVELLISQIKP
ncbi:hypothetical protein AgCh_032464 [Apium graveolens]